MPLIDRPCGFCHTLMQVFDMLAVTPVRRIFVAEGANRVTAIDHTDARRKMVDSQLRTTDITSIAVLDAMGAVGRERFVPASRVALAYLDDDIEIGKGEGGMPRFLMEPSPFGRLLQAASIRTGDKVLIVGAGTGYSAAVLSRLAGQVVALECEASLVDLARATLDDLGCVNVEVAHGALQIGYSAGAPYDVVLLEGAVATIPDALFAQMAERGRLVAVEGQGNSAVARLYLKDDGRVSGRRLFNAAIRPLPGFAAEPAFVF